MDLKELKSKIDKRKSEMVKESTALGETTANVPSSSDSILHELLQAHKTGQPTKAIQKIKAVDQLAEEKRGVVRGGNAGGGGLSQALGQAGGEPQTNMPQQPQQTQQPTQMMPEREQLFEQKMNTTQQSLSASLNGYMTPQQQYQQMMQNGGVPPQQMPPQQQAPTQLNEQVISEAVNNALNENIATMVQEVMKSTIMEMYEADKVKTAILENKNLIKKIVMETVVELSKKNKSTK